MRSILLAAATFAIACTGAAFNAAHAEGTTVAVAHYDDLDLSRESDAKILLKRIDVAAADACRAQGLATASAEYRACKLMTVQTSVAAMDNTVVSAMYAGEPPAVKMADAQTAMMLH